MVGVGSLILIEKTLIKKQLFISLRLKQKHILLSISWLGTIYLSQHQHALQNNHFPCQLILRIHIIVIWGLRGLVQCKGLGQHIGTGSFLQ